MLLALKQNILSFQTYFFIKRKSKRKRYKKKRYLAYLNEQLVSNVNMLNANFSLLIDRGYTGHEHLYTVGLIHMNGRLYDPQLRRFLSPDNYVQDINNTQSFNRFGYVLNNPLLYTDATGELAFLAVIAINVGVSILMKAVNNVINGVPFWYSLGKTAIQSATGSVLGLGLGAALGNMFTTLIFEPSADIKMLGTSFISGLVNSGLNYGVGQLNIQDPGLLKALNIASGAISSGTSSTLAGGDFMKGFAQGAIYGTVNTLANDVFNGNPSQKQNSTTKENQKTNSTGGKKLKPLVEENSLMVDGNSPDLKAAKAYGIRTNTKISTWFGDGRLRLSEANLYYNYGRGESLEADLGKLDLSSISENEFSKINETKYINLLFRGNATDGLVYGTLGFTYKGNSQVTVSHDIYDFDIRPWNSIGNVIRNGETIIGGWVAGKGEGYRINFIGTGNISPKTINKPSYPEYLAYP